MESPKCDHKCYFLTDLFFFQTEHHIWNELMLNEELVRSVSAHHRQQWSPRLPDLWPERDRALTLVQRCVYVGLSEAHDVFTDFMTASTISRPSPGALGRNVSCSRLGSGPGIPSGVDVSNSDKQLTGSPSWAKNQPKSDHGRGRKILSGAVTLSLPRLSRGMFLEYEWESSVPRKLTHRKWETLSVSPGPSVINKSAASARLHRCSQLFWLDLCSGWSVQSRADNGLKMIRKCSDSQLELQQIN